MIGLGSDKNGEIGVLEEKEEMDREQLILSLYVFGFSFVPRQN